MSWPTKEMARERKDWIYMATNLLRALRDLRDRNRISEAEYQRITLAALPDCSWGSQPAARRATDENGGLGA